MTPQAGRTSSKQALSLLFPASIEESVRLVVTRPILLSPA
jgi:hypothetical protein